MSAEKLKEELQKCEAEVKAQNKALLRLAASLTELEGGLEAMDQLLKKWKVEQEIDEKNNYTQFDEFKGSESFRDCVSAIVVLCRLALLCSARLEECQNPGFISRKLGCIQEAAHGLQTEITKAIEEKNGEDEEKRRQRVWRLAKNWMRQMRLLH